MISMSYDAHPTKVKKDNSQLKPHFGHQCSHVVINLACSYTYQVLGFCLSMLVHQIPDSDGQMLHGLFRQVGVRRYRLEEA